MNEHEALVAVRNRLDREGWLQRISFEADGPNCPLGHLRQVLGDWITSADPLYRVLEAASGSASQGFLCFGNWNDAPERTEEEVRAALDKAIAATAPAPADPFPHGVPEEVAA